jgi:Integrase core domain
LNATRKVFDGRRELAYRLHALDGLLPLRRLSALCAFGIDRVGLFEVVLGDEQANVERLDHRLGVAAQVEPDRGRGQLELAVVEYVAWFNNERLHEMLNDRPPREVEELYAVKSAVTTPTQ